MNAPAEQFTGLLAPWLDPATFDATRGSTGAAVELLAYAEAALANTGDAALPDGAWAAYLEHTRHPDFLSALPDAEARNRWAETTFLVIESLGFDLGDLLAQRERAHPERVLFQELTESGGGRCCTAVAGGQGISGTTFPDFNAKCF